MPKLRVLSGRQIVKILEKHGFLFVYQRGSHMKVINPRYLGEGRKITVPNHKSVAKGTILGIYESATESIPEDILHPYFYTE